MLGLVIEYLTVLVNIKRMVNLRDFFYNYGFLELD